TLTGSHNWSSAAENSNNENTVVVHDFDVTNQYLQEFTARYYQFGGGDSVRVSVEAIGPAGGTIELAQNSPNPFGTATGIEYAIPSKLEPFCWLAIFVVCAWLIAQHAPRLLFLHGLMVGVVNSVWITAAHALLFDPYMAHHPAEAEMMQRSIVHAPRLMMLIV